MTFHKIFGRRLKDGYWEELYVPELIPITGKIWFWKFTRYEYVKESNEELASKALEFAKDKTYQDISIIEYSADQWGNPCEETVWKNGRWI